MEGTNLKIYNAVPSNGGNLTQIQGFNVPGVAKFSRPVFGNGRAYVGTAAGFFYGFGAPVNLPLNCSSTTNFGVANLNQTTDPVQVGCTANIATSVTGIALAGNPNFKILNVPNLPLKLKQGDTFSLQAVFQPKQVGPLSSDISVNTTNGVTGYSSVTPIMLKGTGQSVAPLLAVTPNLLSFDGLILNQQFGGSNQTAILSNLGNSDLEITSIQYSVISEKGPFITPNTTSAGVEVGPFTFIDLPSMVPGNSQSVFIVNFDPSQTGGSAVYLTINSNGGSKIFDVVGSAGSYPKALLEFSQYDPVTNTTSWTPYVPGVPFSFGNVMQNTVEYARMRLTNNGTSDATRLSITVSKPPFGAPGIIGALNQIDLAEGVTLSVGESEEATLFCTVPKSQIDVEPYTGKATWTMNLDDPSFTKQTIEFDCNAVSLQAPPLIANGSSLYKYAGCYQEYQPGRQLSSQIIGNDTLTAQQCVTSCAVQGYVFAGAQFGRECWCGNRVPVKRVAEGNCNTACAGDNSEICGGAGLGSSPGTYISLFGDRTRFDGTNVTVSIGPYVNPGVNGFTSQGCYTEATKGRALATSKQVPGNATVGNCLTACDNYKYAGVEYGGECYCGNILGIGANSTLDTDCNMPCKGNSSEYCGAAGNMNLYIANEALSDPNAIFDYTGPSPKQLVGAYYFLGCFSDAMGSRALSQSYTYSTMTLESCMGNATSNNHTYFALQYGKEVCQSTIYCE